MTAWVPRYLGIPYLHGGRDEAGACCWGLVYQVYARELGIVLPAYADASVDPAERASLARLFEDGEQRPWLPVPAAESRPFDVATFSLGPYAAHVGIVVDAGHFLHVERGGVSRVEAFTARRWGSRLLGIRRHEDARL